MKEFALILIGVFIGIITISYYDDRYIVKDYQIDVTDSINYIYDNNRLIGLVKNDTAGPYNLIFTKDVSDDIVSPLIIKCVYEDKNK